MTGGNTTPEPFTDLINGVEEEEEDSVASQVDRGIKAGGVETGMVRPRVNVSVCLGEWLRKRCIIDFFLNNF